MIILSYDELEAIADEQEKEDRRWRLRNRRRCTWSAARWPICVLRRRHGRYHYWIRQTGIPDLPACVQRRGGL